MPRRSAPVLLAFLLVLFASAKEKDKVILPADVLQAQTVLVVIMPEAGEPSPIPPLIAKRWKKWRRR